MAALTPIYLLREGKMGSQGLEGGVNSGAELKMPVVQPLYLPSPHPTPTPPLTLSEHVFQLLHISTLLFESLNSNI